MCANMKVVGYKKAFCILQKNVFIVPMFFTESEGDSTVDVNEGSIHSNCCW